MQLVTHQTGPEGKKVHKVWVEQGTDIARELYLAVVLDRGAQRLTVMASPTAAWTLKRWPRARQSASLPPDWTAATISGPSRRGNCSLAAGSRRSRSTRARPWCRTWCAWPVEKDAVLVEINPLAVTAAGNVVALDAKMDFDESALKRHPDVAALDDPEESDPLERKARELGVNYVRLSGYVGTMVNGAGLAMATMDAIKQAGAEPANFLDAGGGANEQMVARRL